MERVLIVAKTRMNSGICVSGLVRSSNRGIRLIPRDRQNQSSDTEFEVGQTWDIEYQDVKGVEPPHTEDVTVLYQAFVGVVKNLREVLMQRVHPWQGGPERLFDGTLVFDREKAYISRSGPIPVCSTGYWLPDRSLTLDKANNRYYIVGYGNNATADGYTNVLSIPFVGFASPIDQIPPGTLLRVSLARWFQPNNRPDKRCYLQLSGWYL